MRRVALLVVILVALAPGQSRAETYDDSFTQSRWTRDTLEMDAFTPNSAADRNGVLSVGSTSSERAPTGLTVGPVRPGATTTRVDAGVEKRFAVTGGGTYWFTVIFEVLSAEAAIAHEGAVVLKRARSEAWVWADPSYVCDGCQRDGFFVIAPVTIACAADDDCWSANPDNTIEYKMGLRFSDERPGSIYVRAVVSAYSRLLGEGSATASAEVRVLSISMEKES